MTDTVRQDRTLRSDGATATGPGWVLVGSLALNLLLVGALLGGMLFDRGHRRPGSPEGMRGGGLSAFIATLPPARREAIWAATKSRWEELKVVRKDVRRARQALDEALAAEPFDRARLQSAQAQAGEAEARINGPMRALFTEIAASMTLAERRAYLAFKEQSHKRRPGWPPGEEGEPKPGK